MKSFKFILLCFFTIICLNANAQVFISGGFGFSSSGGRVDNGQSTNDKTQLTSFNFSPAIGKYFSDELAFGIQFSFGTQKSVTPNETTTTSSSLGLAPFLRYHFVNIDKFSVYGQGSLGIASGSSKIKSGSITIDGPKTTTVSFNIVPGLSYEISERFALETSINIFSFGYSNEVEKQGDTKDVTSTFGLGAGLDDIANTGALHIGAIFKL